MNIKQTRKINKNQKKNGQMSQLPSVLDMSDCSHYCTTVTIMKTSSLRRRMPTDDGRLVPGQTVMMMRGLGSGQKGTSMALCDWSWLSLPHMCLCPGTTMHCQAVLRALCDCWGRCVTVGGAV